MSHHFIGTYDCVVAAQTSKSKLTLWSVLLFSLFYFLTMRWKHLLLYSCFGSLTGDTFFSRTNCLSDNSSFFATALTCEGTTEGETSHSLITWRTAKLSLIDGNLSRLVLGAITKPNQHLLCLFFLLATVRSSSLTTCPYLATTWLIRPVGELAYTSIGRSNLHSRYLWPMTDKKGGH